MKIDADHILACAGLPFSGIAWTHKDGKYLWDGSLLSNTSIKRSNIRMSKVFSRYLSLMRQMHDLCDIRARMQSIF